MPFGPSGREIHQKPGVLFVCDGCCCGASNRNSSAEPFDRLKERLSRGLEDAGLKRSVRLVITPCLGPCSEANVLCLLLYGRALWFGRMDTALDVDALIRFLADAVGTGRTGPLGRRLETRTFERIMAEATAQEQVRT